METPLTTALFVLFMMGPVFLILRLMFVEPPKVKFKRVGANRALALLPEYKTEEASGMDVYAPWVANLDPGQSLVVPLGLAVELPKGYELQIRPRSSLAAKHGVTVLNSPGTIDSDYRGEIGVILVNHGKEPFHVASGDRIAQFVLSQVDYLDVEWTEEELARSKRGTGGFGSTGK